ncbi:hypothetical protein [Alteromonas oceanisediminis]|uniref:hypothetical protein n=1 Tax=Alteromonas oceanisediminis TaxID=2836180 RepID=UPI0020239599|nr:hypothetical protein [Alteromonas oceanisediminis]
MLSVIQPAQADFSQKLDVQTRVDERSGREVRYQYRVRHYSQWAFDKQWSLNGFIVTGDDFASSHNTFDSAINDKVYIRRVYARHQGSYGKTEVGFIPTYKGRVSSTGLSKDGWIAGVRHVRELGFDNQLEVVVGQLNNFDPAHALDAPDDIDYIEIEYSARMSQRNSYEISLERMTEANFVRTEVRHRLRSDLTLFAELVQRLDEYKVKTVLGVDGTFTLLGTELEYFSYYSYVGEGFGARAELTEDFLGFGHGFSAELSADIQDTQFGWFIRYDGVDDQSRVLAGLSWSL